MSDPRRLLDDAPSDALRAMLVAAREETPSDGALRRTLSAVGAGAAVIGTGAAAGATATSAGAAAASAIKAGTTATAGLFFKWAGVGVVAGLATATVASSLGPSRSVDLTPGVTASETAAAPRNPHPPAPRNPHPPAVRRDAPVPRPLFEGDRAPGSALDSAKLPREASRHAVPRNTGAGYREQAPPNVGWGYGLAAEITALDQARKALASGNPSRALSTLDAYQRDIPNGALVPEALYLRAEAFADMGNLHAAASVAKRLLAIAPHGPHASRARKLSEMAEP